MSEGETLYKFGQKNPVDPMRRSMTTIYLSQIEFELLSTLPGSLLEKERYPYVAENGAVYEINVFRGRHEGLVLAEIEFDTDEELQNPPSTPDGWIEVTGIERYDGGTLAAG